MQVYKKPHVLIHYIPIELSNTWGFPPLLYPVRRELMICTNHVIIKLKFFILPRISKIYLKAEIATVTESVQATGVLPESPESDLVDETLTELDPGQGLVMKTLGVARPTTPVPTTDDSAEEGDEDISNSSKKMHKNNLHQIRDLYSSVRDDSKRLNFQLEQLEDLLENTFGVSVRHKHKEKEGTIH